MYSLENNQHVTDNQSLQDHNRRLVNAVNSQNHYLNEIQSNVASINDTMVQSKQDLSTMVDTVDTIESSSIELGVLLREYIAMRSAA